MLRICPPLQVLCLGTLGQRGHWPAHTHSEEHHRSLRHVRLPCKAAPSSLRMSGVCRRVSLGLPPPAEPLPAPRKPLEVPQLCPMGDPLSRACFWALSPHMSRAYRPPKLFREAPPPQFISSPAHVPRFSLCACCFLGADSVLASSQHPGVYYAALGGMICLNALNARMAVDLFVMGSSGSRVVRLGGKKE